MINHRENFYKRGWSILQSKKPNDIRTLFETLKQQIKNNKSINNNLKKKIKSIDTLRNVANKFEDTSLNSIRKMYLKNCSEKIIKIFSKELTPIFGKQLLIQKYPQVQIHVGCKSFTKTHPHLEMMAAHSPYTYNIWLPFHDLIDKSGIFLIDDKSSVQLCDKEIKKNITNREKLLTKKMIFPKIKFGEALIFNPFVYHGSIYHDSNYARISLDVRFQSLNKPLFQKYNDFFKAIEL